ncbi:MAG: aminotransferase class V-fold PLP-dependent enzyme [Acidimicrobiaceae bacterium]|nr:aminotransferase class V-fold PLP-dependent enzyme [Acidimicrobiaceae bacterium]
MLQNGDPSRRLPNTANLCFAGADAEAVMANMDPVAVSIGSACSAGSIEPSEVLLAMGRSHEAAFESVRFSLGRFTTPEEIDTAIERAAAAVERVRSMT